MCFQEKAYDTWRAKYGTNPENFDDYIFSPWDKAKQWEKAGNSKEANKAKKATLQTRGKVGSPKNVSASDLAAEFAFYTSPTFRNERNRRS